MPSLSVTFTGDSKNLDAAYKRAEMLAAASAKAQVTASKSVVAAMDAEMAALDARLLKQRALNQEIEQGLTAARLKGGSRFDLNRYVNSPSQLTVDDRFRNEQDAKLWAEKYAAAKAAAGPRIAQNAADAMAAGMTGSQVTRITGMTDRLARLRRELLSGGSAAAEARKEIRMLAGAQGIGALADSISGGGGRHRVSLTGAIRESIVIFRELAAGRGAGRIISSATLLGEYLWDGFLAAIISIPGLVAIAGAAIAYFTFEHLKKLNEAMDKTAESMAKAFGDRSRANVDALLEASRAAGELKGRIAELGKVHETLAEQLDETLRKMEEEFQMMRKIAQLQGETPMQEMAAEQAMRRAQLELTNQALEKQRKLAEDAKKADIDASTAAFSGSGAQQRNAMLKDMPGQLEEAREVLKTNTAWVAELGKKSEDYLESLEIRSGPGFNGGAPISKSAIPGLMEKFNDTQQITNSGEFKSLNQVTATMKTAQSLVNNLPGQMAKLEEIQRQLAAEATKKAQGDTQAAKDVITLTQKRDALTDQIGLHEKYDSRTGSLEGRRGGGAGDFTANQRIGAFALPGQVMLIDVARQQAAEQKTTNQILLRIDQAMKKNPLALQSLIMETINGPFR